MSKSYTARRRLIDRWPGFLSSLKSLSHDISVANVGAAVIAAIFGCTGPALIIIEGANRVGLSHGITTSWIFSVYVVGGGISVFMALYYKIPVTGAWSIPGAVLAVDGLARFEFSAMVGAFLVSGILVLILGLTGVVRRVIEWLPAPIVMAMIAGVLIHFCIDVVNLGMSASIVVVSAVAGYLLLNRFVRSVPGAVGALIFGLAAAAATRSFNGSTTLDMGLSMPVFTAPTFEMGAILGVSLPLAVLVFGAENAQASAVLIAERYRPPINAMTVISGCGGMLASIFGGHSANIAGPMTAICASEQAGEQRSQRYAASVVNGILFAAFGVMAGIGIALVSRIPTALVGAVAGLAMIGVVLSAFRSTFATDRFQVGAFASLIIAMSDVTILGIASAFWALLGGVIVSLATETKDFARK